MNNFLPISTLFGGILGIGAIALSYIVVMERTSNRVWHEQSSADVSNQRNYLEKPGKWAAFLESYTQKFVTTKSSEFESHRDKLDFLHYPLTPYTSQEKN